MNDVKIQWLTSDENLFELDWLKFLFSDVQDYIDIKYDYRKINTDHNTVLICNHAVPYRAVLDELRSKGKKYAIVLLSDENLIDPCEWLHDPNCVGCMRNYIHPNFLTNPKVTVFGLGYKRDFHKYLNLKDTEKRDLLWSFAGTLHGDRKKAVDLFKDERPNKVHACSGFGAADGLSTKEYVEMLQESVFALCPSGQDSMDSFRLYEALEAGCIPITLTNSNQFKLYPSYWHGVFKGAELPFVIEKDWEKLHEKVINNLSKDVDIVSKKCKNLWETYKTIWRNKFTTLVKLL
jgi:hypothetical protein